MDDDFLTAAILNWDDVAPPSAPPVPAPLSKTLDPLVLLGILYALAALVLGLRWYHARSR